MTTPLTLRSVKGSELTWDEVDANFTALRTTADQTFMQSRWLQNDFYTGTNTTSSYLPWVNTATSSGTIQNITAVGDDQIHQGGVEFRDSTTAGGGYSLTLGQSLFRSKAGLMARHVFYTYGVSTGVIQMGFMNSWGNNVTANNFAVLRISGTTAQGFNRVNGGTVYSDSTGATLSDGWYTCDIEWTDDSTVRFCVFQDDGTKVYDWSSSSAGWPNPTSSRMTHGIGAWETTTNAAQTLCAVDYLGVGPARPVYIVTPA